jgi:uncharacterized protein YggE
MKANAIRWAIGWVAVAVFFAAATPASGQFPVPDAVTGNGAATIKKAPNLMRMQIQISAEGKSLKEALSKLSQRKEAVRKKLAGMGAADQAITFEDVNTVAADPQQAMERMMRQRMGMRGGGGGGGRGPSTGPAGAGAAASVKVVVTLKAEWPLAAKAPEEILVASQDLQDKVKAADLAEMKTASLEEQERLEEQAGNDFNQEGGPAPGEPVFFFVAKISDDERTKAMAEAFAKAKAQAQELAKAAGAELGGLKQLTGSAAADVDPNQYRYMQYAQYAGAYNYGQGNNADTNEAVGMQAGSVTMRVAVSASFGIK